MADLARFSALFIILCSSPGILREPPFFARELSSVGLAPARPNYVTISDKTCAQFGWKSWPTRAE